MPDRDRRGKLGTGFRPKKRLGQHFLSSGGVVEKILEGAGFSESDVVLEVGPGTGALTLPLARRVKRVWAVEKDAQLAVLLGEKLRQRGIMNVELVNRDILRFDFRETGCTESEKLQVIGNLPYNISSPFLEMLVESRSLIRRAVLMFQLELARRLTAGPWGKDYGGLTLWVQYHARPSVLFTVSRRSFHPPPKVDSMVLELDFGRPFPERAKDERLFRGVVKAAFAHRRKTLLNSLSGAIRSRDELLSALGRCGIDPGRRAETLGMEEFLCLASVLPAGELTVGPNAC